MTAHLAEATRHQNAAVAWACSTCLTAAEAVGARSNDLKNQEIIRKYLELIKVLGFKEILRAHEEAHAEVPLAFFISSMFDNAKL